MAFREVDVVEVREVLRGWLDGGGLRTVAERAGVDRKTARRYVEAAQAAGLCRDAGLVAVTDELVGQVVGVTVRCGRTVTAGIQADRPHRTVRRHDLRTTDQLRAARREMHTF